MSVSKLSKIKANLHDLLILYRDQTKGSLLELQDIIHHCQTYNVNAHTHFLAHTTHINHQLSTIKKPFDTIWLMPRTMTAKGIQELVNYCNTKRITFCSNELDAILIGSAIGFCGKEYSIGTQISHLIRDSLEKQQLPTKEKIIEHIDNYQMRINTKTMLQQNLLLNKDFIFLLSHGELVKNLSRYYEKQYLANT